MIIGIDGNEANVSERVGVSWVAYALLNQFYRQAGPDIQFKIFLKQPPLADLPIPKKNWQYVIIPKRTLWSQIDLPAALFLWHRDLNVFFSPAHYSPRFSPCSTVVMVHDLSYFYFPQDFLAKDLYQLNQWTRYSVQKARTIIAVSQLTKQDLITGYGLAQSKVKVVYNGFNGANVKLSRPDFAIREPYFIALGTLQPRKNLSGLILAFAKLSQLRPVFLYLVGRKGWLYQEAQKLISQYHLQEKIIMTGYLNEAQKWYLLEKATALVMPGWYEGFGLPILEAFSVNTPVIASNTGALPEIAQTAALYFSPDKPDELTKAMSEVLTDAKIGRVLTRRGCDRLKDFSWEIAAAQILKILEG